jgi:hypothetical protein
MEPVKPDEKTLSDPLPFPAHLPPEHWPFLVIRDLTAHEPSDQLAPPMFFYLLDRREWLARDEADAAHIRLHYPRARVTVDAVAYGDFSGNQADASPAPRAPAARPALRGSGGR